MACLGFGLYDVTTSKIALCVGIKWLFYDFPPRPAPRESGRERNRGRAPKGETKISIKSSHSSTKHLWLDPFSIQLTINCVWRVSTCTFYCEFRVQSHTIESTDDDVDDDEDNNGIIVFIVTKEIRTPFVRWLEHPVAQRRCNHRHCCYHSRCCIYYTIIRSQCAVCLCYSMLGSWFPFHLFERLQSYRWGESSVAGACISFGWKFMKSFASGVPVFWTTSMPFL